MFFNCFRCTNHVLLLINGTNIFAIGVSFVHLNQATAEVARQTSAEGMKCAQLKEKANIYVSTLRLVN